MVKVGEDIMRYRVIDKKTKEDITDKYDWVISPNGQLSYNDDGDLIGYPDADVEEVKRGEWIDEDRKDGVIYCSLCGATEKISDSQYRSPRCPLCGAHMIIEIK